MFSMWLIKDNLVNEYEKKSRKRNGESEERRRTFRSIALHLSYLFLPLDSSRFTYTFSANSISFHGFLRRHSIFSLYLSLSLSLFPFALWIMCLGEYELCFCVLWYLISVCCFSYLIKRKCLRLSVPFEMRWKFYDYMKHDDIWLRINFWLRESRFCWFRLSHCSSILRGK